MRLLNALASSNASDAYTIKLRVGKIGTNLYAIQPAAHETKTNVLAWAPRPIKVKAGESFEASGGTAIAGEPELSFHLAGRLESSVIGSRARVTRDFRLPKALRLNLGEDAEVSLA